ncbi:MAG TPA: hypothetical protein PLT91_05635 [Clostridia bacterium]|nr:MAG: hypothetical protein BWX97_00639 [Firmicutes bacterium ADurb.Bin146]HOD93703.1 hypothetical protein [Clostridia bacterium]HQM39703.1 hypothetical protein [Clostridia bacterium]
MKKKLIFIYIVAISLFLLSSCNNEKQPYLIYDSSLKDQELVDSIIQRVPDSIYIEIEMNIQGSASEMILCKHNNIVMTKTALADGIKVISIYNYSSNKAYQYFEGENLTVEEKTYGMELSLTDDEIKKGIDYHFRTLDDIGDVIKAYETEYNTKKAVYIKSSYYYESSELIFEIYLSIDYSYPLYLLSTVDGKDTVEMIVTNIDTEYVFSDTYPDIPDIIEFVNYDNYE